MQRPLPLPWEGRRTVLIATKTEFGILTVVALVLLRLAIGWHFYQEGVTKYTNPNFSSAGFLRQAKGPLAPIYHDMAGDDFHGWNRLLAQPAEAAASDAEASADAPYAAWAEQIGTDWRKRLQRLIDEHGLSKEQKADAGKVFERRRQQVQDYLEENGEPIAVYRHELSRLEEWKTGGMAGDVPFVDARIHRKQAELAKDAAGWRKNLEELEQEYLADLEAVPSDEQKQKAQAAGDGDRLEQLDTAVTYWHLAVGACLLVGLFTRTAALAGAVFLFSVIASQPPWVSGAEPVYYQTVEMFGLLALATTPVGRWGGLDFFVHALLGQCCRGQGKVS